MDLDIINKKKSRKGLPRQSLMKTEVLTTLELPRNYKRLWLSNKKKKKRKESQREEEEDELLTRERKTKKRHEQTNASILVHPVEEKSVPQRLKDLSEIDEKDKKLVHISLKNRKFVAQVAHTPRRAITVQPTLEVREFVLFSAFPKRIKTEATKVKPKFGEKEWIVSFSRNKKNPTSSSSYSESIDERQKKINDCNNIEIMGQW